MTCDFMGPMQRMWICTGCGYIVDETLGAGDSPYLLTPEDERPILCLPPGRSAQEYELAFGWAMADIKMQHYGWLETYRLFCRLVEAIAVVAAGLLVACDATHDGIPDLAAVVAHLLRFATG